jgi:hypothetical protein
MKRASILLALCSLAALLGCAELGGGKGPIQYLPDVRIADVVPGLFAPGITLWTAKVAAETKSGETRNVYVLWMGGEQIKAFPAVGERCTIAYTWKDDWAGALAATNVVGEWRSIERGRRLMSGESATCGAKVYDFYAIPEVDRGVGAEQ